MRCMTTVHFLIPLKEWANGGKDNLAKKKRFIVSRSKIDPIVVVLGCLSLMFILELQNVDKSALQAMEEHIQFYVNHPRMATL
jgi:hypothetical protein